jgi:hypothetical protein
MTTEDRLLCLVWLAAIAHMRGAGVRRDRTDWCDRWRDIYSISDALGHPPHPQGPL